MKPDRRDVALDQEVRAVFFDVSGTLWDANGCTRQVLEIILPRFVSHFPTDDVKEIACCFNAVLFDLPRREHLRAGMPFSKRARFEALLDSYGIRKRALAQDLTRTFDSVRRLVMRQFLRDDAVPVLESLGRRGLTRGVIMNGTPAVQRHLVQSLGLEPHLDHTILAQVEGYNKPDVRLFRRALEVADVEAQEMVYVGDSPLTDLLGASRAGMHTVWFNTGGRRLPRGWPAPDLTISDLLELLAVVRG
jgi:putative hydrolase of the HAD superfamily